MDHFSDVFRGFADLLDYPGSGLLARARACRAMAGEAAGERLAPFVEFVARAEPGRVEEAYTGTFELPPRCPLHVGHHLFGMDRRRTVFMALLAEMEGSVRPDRGRELPDHLPSLLRLVADRRAEPPAAEILSDCLPPAVSKMAGVLAGSESPYLAVFESLALVLEEVQASGGKPAALAEGR